MNLAIIRPGDTLLKFRTVEALLADCPPPTYPEVLTPEGVAAWAFFARQVNREWTRAHLGQQGWKRDARRVKTFEPGVVEYRRFIQQTIWRDSEWTPTFSMHNARRYEGDPPLTDERVMELLQEHCDASCTPGMGGLCQLVYDADRDEFVGVLTPRR